MKNLVLSLLGFCTLMFCTAQAQPYQVATKSNFISPHQSNPFLSKQFPTRYSRGNKLLDTENHTHNTLSLREPKTEKMDSASLRLFNFNTSSWQTYSTVVFEYNDNLLLSFQYDVWINPVSGKREYQYGDEFIYNNQDLIDTYYKADFDTITQSWNRYYRETYTYEDGLLAEETFANLEDSLGWVYTYKHVLTYSSGGLLTEFKYVVWNEETGNWQESAKRSYTYNTQKQVKTIQWYEKNEASQQWELKEREQNIYNGLKLIRTTRDVDSGFGLQPDEKKEYTYTPTGKLGKINFFYWGFAPDWTLKYKEEYEYNSSDDLSAYSNWSYNDQLMSWEGFDRTEYTYTPYHALWFEVHQDWDATTASWVNEYRSELIYDETVDGDMILWPEAQNEENVITTFDKKLLAVVEDTYDESSGQWRPFDSIIPYYSIIFVASQDVQAGALSVFPNPASDEIVIDISDQVDLKFEMYDNLGKRIYHYPLNSGMTSLPIQKEFIPTGLYMWRVLHTSGQFIDSGKIMVLHD